MTVLSKKTTEKQFNQSILGKKQNQEISTMAKKTSAQRSSGPYPLNIREEELKNKVAQDYFGDYDTTKIIGNIDFCIAKVTEKTKGEQQTFFEE